VPRVIQSARRTRFESLVAGGKVRCLAGAADAYKNPGRAEPEPAAVSALVAYLALAVNYSLTG
jgi:hypothetical protein